MCFQANLNMHLDINQWDNARSTCWRKLFKIWNTASLLSHVDNPEGKDVSGGGCFELTTAWHMSL